VAILGTSLRGSSLRGSSLHGSSPFGSSPFGSSLRARLALLMAALAALTALAVGGFSYRLTERRYSTEIRASLDRFADGLTERPDFAFRTCTYGVPPVPPSTPAGVSLEPDVHIDPVARSRGGMTPDQRATDETSADDLNAANQRRRRDRRGRADPSSGTVVQVVQCLGKKAEVVLASRPVALPIDDVDKSIAVKGASSRRARTVKVNDRKFRLLTIGLAQGGAVQIARDLTENEQILASLVHNIAWLVIGASILAALIGLAVASRIARPIRELTVAAEQIANSGQLDVTLPSARAAGETGRLSTAFTSMVDALRTSKAQQTQLVNDASHELRTPLTSLRANIALLKRHPDLPADRQSGIVSDLSEELRELTDLVNELVSLAADETSHEPPETYDAIPVVNHVVSRWQRRTGRTIEVTSPIELTSALIEGHPKSLARATNNLLSNAIKFSPPDSPVTVSLELSDANVAITVDDRGTGFTPNDQAHAFDRFYRSEVHRSLPGSGLGLAIVAKLITDDGGTAVATNNTHGGGRVILRLPVSQPSDLKEQSKG
jgi:two-component system, OmpR family, sensor histidine kinase MprB